jgi:phosphoglycolate phosphatase
MNIPQYLLFDLDGTLIDSIPDLALSLNLLRTELNCPPLSLAEAAAMVGDGVSLLVRRALGEHLFRTEHVERFLRIYDQNLLDNTRCYPDIEALLQQHATKHMAIITNKPHSQTLAILEGLKIHHHFAVIIGGDTYAQKKPDPFPVRQALIALGAAPSQAVMIGDHHTDLHAGQGAGTATCFCHYGFGNSSGLNYDFEAKTAADLCQLFPGPYRA